MTEKAIKWEPILGIDDMFGSISFTYLPGKERSILVTMHGYRNLNLRFNQAIALRYEDECPGNDPLPKHLPILRPGTTFPLIKIEQSNWLSQWPMYPSHAHFSLISSDDLVQLIASPKVDAHWD